MAHSRFAANESMGPSSMDDSDLEMNKSEEVFSSESPFAAPESEGKKEMNLELLLDLKLPLNVELGRTSMQIKDVLELEQGSVIELDKNASDPIDIWINGKKIAEGEVVVIDKHFGVRVTNLVSTQERVKSLGK